MHGTRTMPFFLAMALLLFAAPSPAGACTQCTPTDPALWLNASGLADCARLPEHRLEIDQSCAALVDSKNPENETGVIANPGEAYRFIVPEDQTWCDAWISNSPPNGTRGTFLMRFFSFGKRVPGSLWFALIADIKGDNRPLDCSGDEPVFEAVSGGSIVLYANDAPAFYRNNHGTIYVEIRRAQ